MSATPNPSGQPAAHDWLMQLTNLPTAAGREGCVIRWIERWAADRQALSIERDDFGNLMLRVNEAADLPASGVLPAAPLILTAHLDHPAAVVLQSIDERTLGAAFRGSVQGPYFLESPMLLCRGCQTVARGQVVSMAPPGEGASDPELTVRFEQPVQAQPGDLLVWDVGEPRIDEGGLLHSRACDDLAAVAAALAAMDRLLSEAEQDEAKTGGKPPTDVRLLLTRAEEVGFAGAIAACGSGLIPHDALLINLENSKSDPTDSPIGGGPIVRVGDRQSTFDPDATYRLGRLAQHLADQPSPQGQTPFAFQRKLMPGGICEASAFVAWGYRAGALCLPLGNYHNMDETTGRIAAEHIALADFDRLVTLLTALARPGAWEDPQIAGGLRQRLEGLFDRRRALLEESVRG